MRRARLSAHERDVATLRQEEVEVTNGEPTTFSVKPVLATRVQHGGAKSAPPLPPLHMSIADAHGQVFGGHVVRGCMVRTTAELLLALLPAHVFFREADPRTGFTEFAIRNVL